MTEEAQKARKILQELWHLRRLSEEKKQRLARLMDAATRATSSIEAERISGTGERSRLESVMVQKIDLERQYQAAIRQLDERRYRIQSAIDAIPDAEQKRVLEYRYIDHMGWRHIMWNMHYAEKTSFRRHEEALTSFIREYEKDDSF